SDGSFQARLDGLICKSNSKTHDLYEIKSSTGVDKENLYDVAFQALILIQQIKVDHYYLLHLNKEYIFKNKLDLSKLFLAEDITDKVNKLIPEIEIKRQLAVQAAQTVNPTDLQHCYTPAQCPCMGVCHPNLPEFSIYDIPRLSQQKKQQLLDLGIISARDIPASIDLNDKQWLVVERAKTNTEHIDRAALKTELGKIQFPVYFLDYETCIFAIPLYEGYHPQQQIVFQYSLHKLEKIDGALTHTDHISLGPCDPCLPLLEQLSGEIGSTGTIIVWNKAFEMTMNREMALVQPQYAAFLTQLNDRIFDLGELVNRGYYLHPGFKGSWSIKNVLPVMKPELSYQDLAVNKGDQASIIWWKLCYVNLEQEEKLRLTEALRRYCELDTLAMVELFKVFRDLIK
ncbi:MAG: DUF2779 domain-containing protein, partial [Anaerolineaceae bacterium]